MLRKSNGGEIHVRHNAGAFTSHSMAHTNMYCYPSNFLGDSKPYATVFKTQYCVLCLPAAFSYDMLLPTKYSRNCT